MRKTIIAIAAGLALLALATPARADYAYQMTYFVQDSATQEFGVDLCGDGRDGRYLTPVFAAGLFLDPVGPQVYRCTIGTRWGYGVTDEYLTTDPNCAIQYCYYDNYGYYYCYTYAQGTRDDSFPARYLASSPIDSNMVPLYLCQYSHKDYYGYGKNYIDYVVWPSYCQTGSQMAFLGYAYSKPAGAADGEVLQSAYDQCVAGSGCWGECGADCGGVLGTHYSTSSCLAHDECVCRNGGNVWALECIPGFIVAAVSWVVAAVKSFVKSVFRAIGKIFKKILHFF